MCVYHLDLGMPECYHVAYEYQCPVLYCANFRSTLLHTLYTYTQRDTDTHADTHTDTHTQT